MFLICVKDQSLGLDYRNMIELKDVERLSSWDVKIWLANMIQNPPEAHLARSASCQQATRSPLRMPQKGIDL